MTNKFDSIKIVIMCGNNVAKNRDADDVVFVPIAERLLEYTELSQETIANATKEQLHKLLDDGIDYIRQIIKLQNQTIKLINR